MLVLKEDDLRKKSFIQPEIHLKLRDISNEEKGQKMTIYKQHRKSQLLLRVARHLILNSSYINNLGLYHGKMGIALFFAHYSRYTGESLYEEFAGELLDEIFEQVHLDMPISFESGLCGIGWGIEYLLQHGFVNGDSDDILSEIDNKIMEKNLLRITDRSIRTGVEGISYYINMRLNSSFRNRNTMPFDEKYLLDWESVKKGIHVPDKGQILLSVIGTIPQGVNIISWKLGLERGCAGYAIKKMLGTQYKLTLEKEITEHTFID